jgi:hypothetical protein
LLPHHLRSKDVEHVLKGGTYTFTVKAVDKKIKVKHQPPTQNTATKVLSITIS